MARANTDTSEDVAHALGGARYTGLLTALGESVPPEYIRAMLAAEEQRHAVARGQIEQAGREAEEYESAAAEARRRERSARLEAEAAERNIGDLKELLGERATGQNGQGDRGRVSAVNWPTGPHRGGLLHERANYGRVIGCLGDGLHAPSLIRDELGLKTSATGEALRALVKDGYAEQPKTGHYVLTELGQRIYDELAARYAAGGRTEAPAAT